MLAWLLSAALAVASPHPVHAPARRCPASGIFVSLRQNHALVLRLAYRASRLRGNLEYYVVPFGVAEALHSDVAVTGRRRGDALTIQIHSWPAEPRRVAVGRVGCADHPQFAGQAYVVLVRPSAPQARVFLLGVRRSDWPEMERFIIAQNNVLPPGGRMGPQQVVSPLAALQTVIDGVFEVEGAAR